MTTTAEAADMQPTAGNDLTSLAEQVDRVIAEVSALEPEIRAKALAVKSAIEEFHRSGLTSIVKTLKGDPRGKELLFELVDDPTVYALLTLHGIVRSSPPREEPPAQGALELVQIQLPVVAVEADGRTTVQAAGWVQGPPADSITADRPVAFQAGDASVILICSKGGLRAFRNACAHQGLPLERGVCDAAAGTITCPWHGFQFDSESGECFSAPQCQLEPFPLRVTDGIVWVSPT
jgi:nitrite reductase/ring-hydroxylating ferredoxin subunit